MSLTKTEARDRKNRDEKVKNHVFIAKDNLRECVKGLKHSQMIYSCREVSIALTHIETALLWLDYRYKQDLVLCVEGEENEKTN